MGLKLSNNAVSRLASGITNTETSISLTPGSGTLFPALAVGDWFNATLLKADGTLEIELSRQVELAVANSAESETDS